MGLELKFGIEAAPPSTPQECHSRTLANSPFHGTNVLYCEIEKNVDTYYDLCNSAAMITLLRDKLFAIDAIPPRQFWTAIGGYLLFAACRKKYESFLTCSFQRLYPH